MEQVWSGDAKGRGGGQWGDDQHEAACGEGNQTGCAMTMRETVQTASTVNLIEECKEDTRPHSLITSCTYFPRPTMWEC